MTYSPGFPGHCGYAAVLHMSGVMVSMKTIMALRERERVACLVKQSYLNDTMLGGHRVRQIIGQSGHSLAAYEAYTKHDMWASAMEIDAATQIMGVTCLYAEGQSSVRKMGTGKPLGLICTTSWTLHCQKGAQGQD